MKSDVKVLTRCSGTGVLLWWRHGPEGACPESGGCFEDLLGKFKVIPSKKRVTIQPGYKN